MTLNRTRIADAIIRPQLRPYQQQARDGIEAAWMSGHRNALAVLPTGAGKCLARDTPVLMYDGTIRMVQDVHVGDTLMGPDSTPRTVLSLARGREMMYRITPVKGEPYVVNESHILSLKRTNTNANPKFPCQDRGGEIVNVSVRDYLSKSKYWKHIHKGWRAGVDWEEKQYDEVLLPPYLLGLWLGDGSTAYAAITTADDEIVEYIRDYADRTGHRVRPYRNRPDNAAQTYHLPRNGEHTGSLKSALRASGVLGNKHIPDNYKLTSRRVRLELLAGILDSDGYLGKGSFDITLKVKQLADDVTFLARSLGFACYMTPCRKGCQTGFVGDYWRMSISGDFSEVPFVRNRHKDNVTSRCQKKSVLMTGIKVEPVAVDDYYGFEIDGDRLFMLGDFTVTHNTVLFSSILADEPGASCAVAHRQELVSQISLALARNRVRHRIIGPQSVVKMIVRLHMEEVGASYYDPSSRCAVAGVDTLVRRDKQLAAWLPTVKLWVMDEAHHVLRANKWGTAVQMFPNARGLGVTATPCRADGNGLGRHADGVFDTMVIGPTMRDLISMGFLTEYRIFAPPNNIDMSGVRISDTTGDFNERDIVNAVSKSSLVAHDEKQIVGDIVQFYINNFKGLRNLVFLPSVATAEDIAEQFNSVGVPAKCIHAGTDVLDRAQAIRDFKSGKLQVLTNSAIFSEGTDIPAVEVIQDASPTDSYSMFVQRFGRMLRLLDGKQYGIYSDHAGNVMRHAAKRGLPDTPQKWSLDRREKRSAGKSDAQPVRACVKCTAVYERYLDACPFCGEPIPAPAQRNAPEFVDGDLYELDADTLARMRAEVVTVDMDTEEYRQHLQAKFVPQLGVLAGVKRHKLRQEAIGKLREAMAQWGGYERAAGLSDSEIYRKFYQRFGVDMLSAQALKTDEATTLCGRVMEGIRV